MQQSMVTAFWGLGRGQASARYGSDPTDLGSWFDGAYAVWSAGEPYGAGATAVREAWKAKSAMFSDGYFAALKAGTVKPVPVFAVSGWTDPVFPVAESLQMYRKLRAADADYPISIAFADIGHQFPANTAEHWQAVMTEANRFLDAHLARKRFEPVSISLAARCDAPSTSWVTAKSWDALAGRAVTLPAADTVLRWDPDTVPLTAGSDPVAEPVALDPAPCVTATDPGRPFSTIWFFDEDTTALGLPTVRFDYALVGAGATIVAKLWDTAPDGTRTLITRGVYRIDLASGDPIAGSVAFDLFGTHWEVPAGHGVMLEMAASDMPFLRPSNLPFTVALSSLQLDLPVRTCPPPSQRRAAVGACG